MQQERRVDADRENAKIGEGESAVMKSNTGIDLVTNTKGDHRNHFNINII